MCTLPVNIVNEKIYVILWFAFLAHTLVSLLQLIRQAQLLKLRLIEIHGEDDLTSGKLPCSWSPSAPGSRQALLQLRHLHAR